MCQFLVVSICAFVFGVVIWMKWWVNQSKFNESRAFFFSLLICDSLKYKRWKMETYLFSVCFKLLCNLKQDSRYFFFRPLAVKYGLFRKKSSTNPDILKLRCWSNLPLAVLYVAHIRFMMNAVRNDNEDDPLEIGDRGITKILVMLHLD